MNFMNAVDTNVLVYRLDRHNPTKQAKARELLRRLASESIPTVLLWQVLGELMRQLRYWQDEGEITREALVRYVAAFRKLFPLVTPTSRAVDHALDLTGQYSLSHWDSMLLGACKDAGATVLYTEDMGAPTTYDGIQLINPFA
jgi:predicted nucleic acid-binding protein